MDKIVEVKVNKKTVVVFVGLMVIELGVMGFLLWPKKVR